MEHIHSHHHDHFPTLINVNTAFIIGILLNFLFVVIEVIVGLLIHSLSLLSDAGHNLADVGALALSLLAYRLLKVNQMNITLTGTGRLRFWSHCLMHLCYLYQ